MSKKSRQERGEAYAAYKRAREKGKNRMGGKQFIRRYNPGGWRSRDISKDVGKKNYTEGQKNYMRAIKTIEDRLGNIAADLKLAYGSDDIIELADQYYISELSDYSEEELRDIEREFSKTHGYKIRIEKAVNPFSGIDFLNM